MLRALKGMRGATETWWHARAMDGYHDPAWIARWLREDNGDLPAWSARVEFGSAAEATAALSNFPAAGATKATLDGSTSQVVINFDPGSVQVIANSIAASGGTICRRFPRVPRAARRP
jgi:hypothetical protein